MEAGTTIYKCEICQTHWLNEDSYMWHKSQHSPAVVPTVEATDPIDILEKNSSGNAPAPTEAPKPRVVVKLVRELNEDSYMWSVSQHSTTVVPTAETADPMDILEKNSTENAPPLSAAPAKAPQPRVVVKLDKVCPICGKKFFSDSKKNKHILISHGSTDQLNCLSCKKKSYCKPRFFLLGNYNVMCNVCQHCKKIHVTHILDELHEIMEKEKNEMALSAISFYKKKNEIFRPW